MSEYDGGRHWHHSMALVSVEFVEMNPRNLSISPISRGGISKPITPGSQYRWKAALIFSTDRISDSVKESLRSIIPNTNKGERYDDDVNEIINKTTHIQSFPLFQV